MSKHISIDCHKKKTSYKPSYDDTYGKQAMTLWLKVDAAAERALGMLRGLELEYCKYEGL